MCLRLKGDCGCVCIFHQRIDFLYCTIVCILVGSFTSACLKCQVALFYFRGMSPVSFPVWSKHQSKSKWILSLKSPVLILMKKQSPFQSALHPRGAKGTKGALNDSGERCLIIESNTDALTFGARPKCVRIWWPESVCLFSRITRSVFLNGKQIKKNQNSCIILWSVLCCHI